jgi:hypothetical protein
MAASGALEHYTDLAYARWDLIEPPRFPQVRRRIEERGGLWYALLFPSEAEEMFKQPRGRWKKIGVLRDVGLYELQKEETTSP